MNLNSLNLPVNSTTLLIAGAVLLALIAAVVLIVSRRRSRPNRLVNVGGTGWQEAAENRVDTRQQLRALLERSVGTRMSGTSFEDQLRTRLQRASIRATPAEWAFMVFLIALGVSGFCAFWFGTLFVVPVAFLAAWIASSVFLNIMANRNAVRFERQLAPVVVSLANSLRSGSTFVQALAANAEVTPPPLGPEMDLVVRKGQLNVSLTESLMDLSRKMNSTDVELLAQSVEISRVTGGNMADVLEQIGEDIRERTRLAQTVRTLTAQARASAWVVSCLPFALFLILIFVSPDYFSPMLHSGPGLAILAFCGVSIGMGVGLIRRLIRVSI